MFQLRGYYLQYKRDKKMVFKISVCFKKKKFQNLRSSLVVQLALNNLSKMTLLNYYFFNYF